MPLDLCISPVIAALTLLIHASLFRAEAFVKKNYSKRFVD